jgi:hypothetical protein
MAITTLQSPHRPFNMAYGPNPITLQGINPVSQDKYVLQLFKLGALEPFADLRQTPNKNGRAIFDIQNSLQTQIGPGGFNQDALNYDQPGTQGSTKPLVIAYGQIAAYTIKYGDETNGITTVTSDNIVYNTLGGIQPYYIENFPTDLYVPEVKVETNGCTTIKRFARALSDNKYQISKFETGDELLQDMGFYTIADSIDVHNVYIDDQCTKSFYNLVENAYQQQTEIQGIEAYWLISYHGNQNHDIKFVTNTVNEGGGPNTQIGDGIEPTGNYLVSTIATGPANIAAPILDPDVTHYYVIPTVFTEACDNQYGENLVEGGAWRPQRYNILKKPCNDYPHVQFAWMNSYGMRDQFTFTKKVEKEVIAKRNNFLQEGQSYNSGFYSQAEWQRGETTYSQELKEVYTVTSGYMTDQEAATLESLVRSASVTVRFSTTSDEPLCYDFTISNPEAAGSPARTYSYVQCDGTNHFRGIQPGESQSVCGRSVDVSGFLTYTTDGLCDTPGNETGLVNQWQPIVLKTSSYIEKTYRKDRLFQYTIKFTMANNLKSQRG